MKNLKINKESFKKIISTGLVLVTLSNLTGCSLNSDKEETNTNSKSLETVIANNKMILVSDLRLKDTESNQIIQDVDKVLVGNKLEEGYSFIDIMFNSSIEAVLINDELVPVDRLKLVNSKTNEELNAIDYALVGDELVPVKDYFNNTNTNSSYEYNGNRTNTSETSTDEEEYEELTDEKFYALADEIYKKYSEIGLDVKYDEVVDFTMMVNIDKIAKDNKELITTIIGDRATENVEYNAFDVYSAINSKNNDNYCSKGLGWESLILVSDTVFDKTEKETVIKIENRIKEIFDARDNKGEFNTLLNTLLMEMLNATEEEFNMEYGTGYSVMQVLVNFIRINFINILDNTNAELIKNFILFADEYDDVDKYGRSYYMNSRLYAYYSGIYNFLTDNVNCYTKTK